MAPPSTPTPAEMEEASRTGGVFTLTRAHVEAILKSLLVATLGALLYLAKLGMVAELKRAIDQHPGPAAVLARLHRLEESNREMRTQLNTIEGLVRTYLTSRDPGNGT